jgi:hypothetical protein
VNWSHLARYASGHPTNQAVSQWVAPARPRRWPLGHAAPKPHFEHVEPGSLTTRIGEDCLETDVEEISGMVE